MSALYRLLAYARPHRTRLAGALAAMVIYAAASAKLATLVKPIFDSVLPARERLVSTIVAILVVYAAKGFGAYLSSYLMTDVGQRVVRDLRNRMFRHMVGQSAAFFTAQTTGRLMSRLTNDVSQVQRVVSDTIGDLARETLTLIGYLAVLIYYDARLTVVCLTSAPLIVYPLVRLGQRVRRTTRRTQEAQEQMAHVSAEALTGHRIVKAFGAEARESAKFEKSSERFYRTSMRVTSVLSMLPPLMEMIGGVAFATALWVGSQEIASKRLTTGDFVAFITALFLMYAPARKLSRVNADLQQAAAAAERIFEILETHSEVHERPDAVALPRFSRSIEFRDVHFSYGNGHDDTLQGVTFAVGAGQMLAIVGRSGAGKTTLVNLLPRFYDVTTGAILIDGRDVRDVTLASLRSQIGLVTQETVLFDDTIAANIAYGMPQATRESIEAAARAAHAHDFILALDQGYETMIGERGQRLSGGQRQRLAIARAIVRDSPILILDEATSSLDAESEALVQDALVTLMRNRTSFVIAHRLSTVRRADAIVVLGQGHIIECGTHDELMARRGAYAKLYELQFEDEPPEIEA
ncbi:MAG TPA: lipid A export permease/ATP-binding protein MsbA [Vicinamibacterales bacterium]|nr:lipid A export permease/ATP-binding protein MsbA [Vicinamibacterales bacterium]